MWARNWEVVLGVRGSKRSPWQALGMVMVVVAGNSAAVSRWLFLLGSTTIVEAPLGAV